MMELEWNLEWNWVEADFYMELASILDTILDVNWYSQMYSIPILTVDAERILDRIYKR